jgi:hypothetical protein
MQGGGGAKDLRRPQCASHPLARTRLCVEPRPPRWDLQVLQMAVVALFYFALFQNKSDVTLAIKSDAQRLKTLFEKAGHREGRSN